MTRWIFFFIAHNKLRNFIKNYWFNFAFFAVQHHDAVI